MSTTIAFIGAGAMGARMAANLQAAGYSLRVDNRDRAKTKALADQGAAVCDSPATAAKGAESVVSTRDPASGARRARASRPGCGTRDSAS